MRAWGRTLALLLLAALAARARATSVANVAIAPACPTAGSWVTVTADVTIDSWQGGSYAIAFSNNTTPDSADTWNALSMSGSCPGNGYAAGTAGASPTLFHVTRSFALPGTVTFPGSWYVIVIAASNSWIGSCSGSANANTAFSLCYYSPTFTVTPTPRNTPTVSPTGVQNVARTTFGPSNWVGFIVVSPTQTTYGSPTHSPTVTPSPTASPTPTQTATSTATPTSTPSATPSSTRSSTPTFSDTPSSTPSMTVTFSATQTPSFTGTPSFSDTPSMTPTMTPTASFTGTPSFSDTPSMTPTMTSTNSFTGTPSFSDTPSMTPSMTSTNSFTDTPSFTDSPSATATETPSNSFTPSPTFSATPTPSFSFTDTPTFSDTPTRTDSPTPSATRTPTPSFTATPTATLTHTPSPTFSVSPTRTASPTVSPTPIPEPFHIVLAIYNSAGELVRQIYSGSAQSEPTSLNYSVLPPSGNAPITISIGGIQSVNAAAPVLWTGDNNTGQPVQNGTYYLKMETTDPFGKVTSFIRPVTVLGASSGDSLAIYNSAGELVRSIALTGYTADPVDFRMEGFSGLSGTMLGGVDPATGKPRGDLKLDLIDGSGGLKTFSWDGMSNSGNPVASGLYTVKLVKQQAGQELTVKTGTVMVLNAPGSPAESSVASAVVGPNPLMGQARAFVLSYTPSAQGTGHVRFFSLSGELVASGVDLGGTGALKVDASRCSAGVYLVDFEIDQGSAVLARRIIKVVIVR